MDEEEAAAVVVPPQRDQALVEPARPSQWRKLVFAQRDSGETFLVTAVKSRRGTNLASYVLLNANEAWVDVDIDDDNNGEEQSMVQLFAEGFYYWV